MSDPILHGLRQASDETLYLRLTMLRHRFPDDYRAEDYEYRRDVWESANKAVHAEIRRRRASPPAWWAKAEQVVVRERLRGAGAIGVCVLAGVFALAMIGPAALPPAVMMTLFVWGAVWLFGEVRKNQRL